MKSWYLHKQPRGGVLHPTEPSTGKRSLTASKSRATPRNLIKAIQSLAVRFIMSDYAGSSCVSSMKSNLNLLSLSSCRRICRISHLHKALYTPILKQALLRPPNYIFSRFDNSCKIARARRMCYSQAHLNSTPSEAVVDCCRYSLNAVADSLLSVIKVRITCHCLLKTASCVIAKCDLQLSFHSQRRPRATVLLLQLGTVPRLIVQPFHYTLLKYVVVPKSILHSSKG